MLCTIPTIYSEDDRRLKCHITYMNALYSLTTGLSLSYVLGLVLAA